MVKKNSLALNNKYWMKFLDYNIEYDFYRILEENSFFYSSGQ